MRKTLNKAMVKRDRDDVSQGGLPDDIFLEWSAYRQLHVHAQSLGLLGRDAPLPDVLDERLAHFEECAWLGEDEPRKECPKCKAPTTMYSDYERCPVCRVKLVEVNA